MVQEPSNLYLAAASPACRASQVAGQQSVGAWPGTCSSRAEQALRGMAPLQTPSSGMQPGQSLPGYKHDKT